MSDLRGVLIPTVPDSKVTTLTTGSQWMWQSSVEDVWDMRGVSKTPQIDLRGIFSGLLYLLKLRDKCIFIFYKVCT